MTRAAVLFALTDNQVTPGVLGFVVVALLGLATYLLIRSMNRQIKRIDVPDEPSQAEGSATDGTGKDAGDEPAQDG